MISCPWCQKELVIEKDSKSLPGRRVCYCGSEPEIINLTCTFYREHNFTLFANFPGSQSYLTFAYDNKYARIFVVNNNIESREIYRENLKENISMEDAVKILKRYFKLKVFL